jgi:small subunit ribosomal protein S3
VTDESAFKSQVRARMAETGEKYTMARRIVIEDTAIRDALQRDFEPAGVCRIEIERTADRVRIEVHSVRPSLVVGRRGEEADRIRGELAELTGKRISLAIWEARSNPAQDANQTST